MELYPRYGGENERSCPEKKSHHQWEQESQKKIFQMSHEITVRGLNLSPFFPFTTLEKKKLPDLNDLYKMPAFKCSLEDSEQITVSCQIQNRISKWVVHVYMLSLLKDQRSVSLAQFNQQPFPTYDSLAKTISFCICPHDTSINQQVDVPLKTLPHFGTHPPQKKTTWLRGWGWCTFKKKHGDLTSFRESLNISSLTRLPFYLTSLAGITNLRSCHVPRTDASNRSQNETQNETVKGWLKEWTWHTRILQNLVLKKKTWQSKPKLWQQNSKQLCYKHRGHYTSSTRTSRGRKFPPYKKT